MIWGLVLNFGSTERATTFSSPTSHHSQQALGGICARMYLPIYSAAMPVLVSCLHPFASFFAIHAYLELEPDHSCVRVSMSVEHRSRQYIIPLYTPGGYISRVTHWAAAVFLPVRFYMGTRARRSFLGFFQVCYWSDDLPRGKGKGPWFPYINRRSLLGGRKDGHVSYTVCGIPEVGPIFADFKRWLEDQTEAAGHEVE